MENMDDCVILAKTRLRHNGGGFCFIVYSRTLRRKIRPIPKSHYQPNDPLAPLQQHVAMPFWPNDEPYKTLQVGHLVELRGVKEFWLQQDASVTSPHQREDLPCERIAQIGFGHRLTAGELIRLLEDGATISPSVAAAWPHRETRRANAVRRVNGQKEVSSCIFVRGVIRKIMRVSHARVRACLVDFEHGTNSLGERIEGVAVTACDIVEADLSDVKYGHGVLILGLARDRLTPDTHAMLLVGFLLEPQKQGLEFWELNEIFFSSATDMQLCRKRQVFLDFVRSSEERMELAAMLEEAYETEVHFHESIGCAVVFKQLGAGSRRRYPGEHCGVYVVAPSSVGNFKRKGIFLFAPTVDAARLCLTPREMLLGYVEAISQEKQLNVALVIKYVNEVCKIGIDSEQSSTPPVAAKGGGQKLLNVVTKLYLAERRPCHGNRLSYKDLVIEYQLHLIEGAVRDLVQRGPLATCAEMRAAKAMLGKTLGKVDKFVSRNLPAVLQSKGAASGPFRMSEQVEGWRNRLRCVVDAVSQLQAQARESVGLEYTFPDIVDGTAALLTTRNAVVAAVCPPPVRADVVPHAEISRQLARAELNSPSVKTVQSCAPAGGIAPSFDHEEITESFDHFEKAMADFFSNASGLNSSNATGLQHLQLLKDFENFVFALADESRFDAVAQIDPAPSKAPELAKQLEKLLTGYLKLSDSSTEGPGACMHRQQQPQQQSTAALVAHCLACMSFEVCKAAFAECMVDEQGRLKYDIGLSGQKLQALLLQGGQPQRVVLNVYRYLQENGHCSKPLFRPSHPQATVELGRAVAAADKTLLSALELEMQNRAARAAAYDREQARRASSAVSLRKQIQEVKKRRAEVEKLLCDAPVSLGLSPVSCDKSRLTARQRQLSAELGELRSGLAAAEKPPETIEEPLPEGKEDMQAVLFLVRPPTVFQALASVTFLAENAFLPKWGLVRSTELAKEISDCNGHEGKLRWDTRYNAQDYRYCRPSDVNRQSAIQGLLVYFHRGIAAEPPLNCTKAVYPKMDAEMRSTALPANNPFIIASRLDLLCKHIFVERLVDRKGAGGADGGSLGWTLGLACRATEDEEFEEQKSREARAIATQDQCPDWLSLAGYVEFCSMRAHSTPQLRNLLRALRSRVLPLTDLDVHQLFRQTLYHVGPFFALVTGVQGEEASEKERGSRPREATYIRKVMLEGYHQDLGLLQAFHDELSSLVSDHKDKERDYVVMSILAELASAFTPWHAPCALILIEVAEATSKWADRRLDHMPVEELDSDTTLISSNLLCSLAAYLALPAADLCSDPHLANMLAVKMLLHSNPPPQSSAGQGWQDELRSRVRGQSAATILTIIDTLGTDRRDTILSQAVLKAFKHIEDASQLGPWERLESSKTNTVFWAESTSVYSLNVLTGEFLVGGEPPQRLPGSIREQSLYERTFKTADFKVVPEGGSVFRTIRSFGGASYEFRLSPSRGWEAASDISSLQCIETIQHGENQPLKLELIDPEHLCQFFRQPISRHLVELHTHWLCRALGVIFFKSLGDVGHFQEDALLFPKVHYVLVMGETMAADAGQQGAGIDNEGDAVMSGDEDSATDENAQCLPRKSCCLPISSELYDARHVFMTGGISFESKSDFLQSLTLRCGPIKRQLCLPTKEDRCADRVLEVLSKFEAAEHIRLYSHFGLSFDTQNCSSTNELAINEMELTRYGLNFERNGEFFESREHAGYKLSACQMLPGNRLFGFWSYLLLEPRASSDGRRGPHDSRRLRILMRDGVLKDLSEDGRRGGRKRAGAGMLLMESGVFEEPEEEARWAPLSFFQYDIEEKAFSRIISNNIESRLQLAGLYILTDSPIQETSSGKGGAEVAVDLLRESAAACFKPGQMKKLHDLNRLVLSLMKSSSVMRQRMCTLNILIKSVCVGASNLVFCFFPDHQNQICASDSRLKAVADYIESAHEILQSARFLHHIHLNGSALGMPSQLLEAEEEIGILGCSRERDHITSAAPAPVITLRTGTKMGKCPCLSGDGRMLEPKDFVKHKEGQLQGLASVRARNCESENTLVPDLLDKVKYLFRDRERAQCSKNGEEIYDEKFDSYKQFKRRKIFEIADKDSFLQTIEQQLCEIQGAQKQCFDYILSVLRKLPNDGDFHNMDTIREADKAVAWLFSLRRDVEEGVVSGREPAASHQNEPPDVASQERFVCFFCRILLKPEILQEENPFHHKDVLEEIRESIFIFLEMRVLGDRVIRLRNLCEGGPGVAKNEISILDELRCTREWDSRLHPSWLVLESHLRFQIRPRQYLVAKDLIDNTARISQLNMGEGKTRVIMPMLVLYWTRDQALAKRAPPRRQALMRVTVLSPLLDELRDVLHQSLTASALNVKIFELPFNRDVDMSVCTNVDKLHSMLEECVAVGGVLLVTPEHRLSLLLKYYELAIKAGENADSVDARALARLKDVVHFEAVDLLDEADEILRNKFQLVYAIGELKALDCGADRWNTMVAVLRVLQESKPVRDVLEQYPNVFTLTGDEQNPQAFAKCRFLPGTPQSEHCKQLLVKTILDAVFEERSRELSCLCTLGNKDVKDFKKFVISKSTAVDLQSSSGAYFRWQPNVQKAALVLHGVLAHGILFHCLEKVCHRDFGPPARIGGKQMAVPYLAADTPSQRAEFSHPDVAIFLTFLSWYWTGLSDRQVELAFRELLRSGANARSERYGVWLKLSRRAMTEEHAAMLGNSNKIDLADAAQFQLLCSYFRCNYETVNYFVLTLILPRETKHFSQQITANPWDLARGGGQTRGFSGTKDNKYMLPLSIEQKTIPELMYTDGKMLALLSQQQNLTYKAAPRKLKDWREVLDCALFSDTAAHAGAAAAASQEPGRRAGVCEYSVLLDAGGTMAGASNKEVASYILSRLLECGVTGIEALQGVVYFDAGLHGWAIMDPRGQSQLMRASPVQPSECFAFYDESRTRGADLKLRREARALMTLSLGIRKDQVMQAFGRLRGLDLGQSVSFFGSQEVDQSIRLVRGEARADPPEPPEKRRCSEASKRSRVAGEGSEEQCNSMDVLLWTIVNTVQSIDSALILWANQGATFCTVRGDPMRAPQHVSNDLVKWYGSPLEGKQVAKIVEEVVEVKRKQIALDKGQNVGLQEEGNSEFDTYLEDIVQKGKDFGGSRTIERRVLDEELEMELQKEEQEEFVRVNPPLQPPACEERWEYPKIFEENALDMLSGTRSCCPRQFYPFEAVLLETALLGDASGQGSTVRKFLAHGQRAGDTQSILVTANFRATLEVQQQVFCSYSAQELAFEESGTRRGVHGRMDAYLRPRLKFALFFHRKQVIVCLSCYEAHRILQLFYERSCQQRALQEPAVGLPPDLHDLVHNMTGRPDSPLAGRQREDVSFFDVGDLFLPTRDTPSPGRHAASSIGESAGSCHDGAAAAMAEPEDQWVEPKLALHSRSDIRVRIPEQLVAQLALLNGECMYGNAVRKAHVKAFLNLDAADARCKDGVELARRMVQLRGREQDMDHSDLEQMISEVDG